MIFATVCGRITNKPQLQIFDSGQARIVLHIWAKASDRAPDVMVSCCVMGKRAKEVADYLDDDVFVTCVGALRPVNPDGFLHLYMQVAKIDLQGFYIEDEMAESA